MTEEITRADGAEVDKPRTIEVITAEIVMIRRAANQIALQIAVELGRRLAEAKALLPYGEWGAWVRDKAEFSQVTATRYMRLYEEYAAPQGSLFGAETDFSTLKNLSVSKALALLAVPAGEREAFAAENHVEDLSTRKMNELMEQVKAANDAKETAEAALAGERLEKEKTAAERDDLAERVKELESRPVEVAVQEPDPEELQRRVDDAVNEATARLKEESKDLRAKLKETKEKAEKLEKTVAEGQKALAAAEEKSAGTAVLEGERDRLKEQIERLEKQLAMSDAAVAAVNVHFEAVQRELGQLSAGLASIENAEVRQKVRGAVLTLLDKLRGEIGAIDG